MPWYAIKNDNQFSNFHIQCSILPYKSMKFNQPYAKCSQISAKFKHTLTLMTIYHKCRYQTD